MRGIKGMEVILIISGSILLFLLFFAVKFMLGVVKERGDLSHVEKVVSQAYIEVS